MLWIDMGIDSLVGLIACITSQLNFTPKISFVVSIIVEHKIILRINNKNLPAAAIYMPQ